MLLFIDGEVIEIRPSEFFESKVQVDSRYLELVIEDKPKKGRPKKAPLITFEEEINGSSSAQN